MKRYSIITGIILSATLLFGGCMKEDIDELRKQQEENAVRITALEKWQQEVNSQISELQSLVDALMNKDFVTEVVPLVEDGETVGYTIYFTKSGPVTIRHGEKGEQGEKGDAGHSPRISVDADTDGLYYWTLDGEWLLDANDRKIPVTGDKGDKGEPGKNAVAPKVRINADTNYWEISTDGGTSWTSTNVKATGPQGESMFSSVYQSENLLILTLEGSGAEIRLPRYKELKISFSMVDGTPVTEFWAMRDEPSYYNYTITGNPTIVRMLDCPTTWEVTLFTNGRVRVKCLAPGQASEVDTPHKDVLFLLADDYRSTMVTIPLKWSAGNAEL